MMSFACIVPAIELFRNYKREENSSDRKTHEQHYQTERDPRYHQDPPTGVRPLFLVIVTFLHSVIVIANNVVDNCFEDIHLGKSAQYCEDLWMTSSMLTLESTVARNSSK